MKKLGVYKKYVIIVVVVILLCIVAFAAFRIGGFFPGSLPEVVNETVINVSNLQQQIVSIGELATTEYNYRNVIVMQDSHSILGWDIPFTQRSYIIMVEGTMKIGIDASDISVSASEENKIISIIVPKAKILTHVLHEDTIEVLEENSGLFNRVRIEDWATMAIAQKEEMEEKISDTDIFNRAENDAVRMLQALISGVVPEDYTVNVTGR